MPVVAKLSDVPPFGKRVVTVGEKTVILANLKGEIFAFENECPHQGAPLEQAIVRDGYVSCPRHGYRFDLKSGVCRDHPEFTLTVYPVSIQGDDIVIDLDG